MNQAVEGVHWTIHDLEIIVGWFEEQNPKFYVIYWVSLYYEMLRERSIQPTQFMVLISMILRIVISKIFGF